jgi:Tol biopolymer transport system component
MDGFHLMRFVLWLAALLLVMMVALLTISRRDFSGAWIAFEGGYVQNSGIFLMTGDGGSVRRLSPENLCATRPRWFPNGARISFQSDDCSGGFSTMLQIRPGASHPQQVGSNIRLSPMTVDPITQTPAVRNERLLIPMGLNDPPKVIPLDPPFTQVSDMHYSPDGAWMAFLGGQHIYRVPTAGIELEQLTEQPSNILDLQWSPDGKWLIFTRANLRYADIYRIHADGSSLQHLASGLSPHVAPTSGRAWNPFGLMTIAIFLLFLSLAGHFRL